MAEDKKEKSFPIFVIKSKYESPCPRCNKMTSEGDPIFFFPTIKNSRGKGTVSCLDCGIDSIKEYFVMTKM